MGGTPEYVSVGGGGGKLMTNVWHIVLRRCYIIEQALSGRRRTRHWYMCAFFDSVFATWYLLWSAEDGDILPARFVDKSMITG